MSTNWISPPLSHSQNGFSKILSSHNIYIHITKPVTDTPKMGFLIVQMDGIRFELTIAAASYIKLIASASTADQ